jgi:hypothetical protein
MKKDRRTDGWMNRMDDKNLDGWMNRMIRMNSLTGLDEFLWSFG